MTVISRFRSTSTRRTRHTQPNTKPDTQLDRDLATFRSPAELADLAALLDRYPDAAAAPIRDRVRWVAA